MTSCFHIMGEAKATPIGRKLILTHQAAPPGTKCDVCDCLIYNQINFANDRQFYVNLAWYYLECRNGNTDYFFTYSMNAFTNVYGCTKLYRYRNKSIRLCK